jgi:hypothetical protein
MIWDALGTQISLLSLQNRIPRFKEISMAEKDLSALFLDTLKDIYYAEK